MICSHCPLLPQECEVIESLRTWLTFQSRAVCPVHPSEASLSTPVISNPLWLCPVHDPFPFWPYLMPHAQMSWMYPQGAFLQFPQHTLSLVLWSLGRTSIPPRSFHTCRNTVQGLSRKYLCMKVFWPQIFFQKSATYSEKYTRTITSFRAFILEHAVQWILRYSQLQSLLLTLEHFHI